MGSTEIRVWDLKSGELLRVLGTSNGAVWKVGFVEERVVAVFYKGRGVVLNVGTSSHCCDFVVPLGFGAHPDLGCTRLS